MSLAEPTSPDRREQKKAETRSRLRESAMRLIAERGYDATTVEAIAADAGVSHMTFFRYFPTKEDVILDDGYDEVIVESIHARPADEAPGRKLCWALLDSVERVYAEGRDAMLAQSLMAAEVPQLRARLWENQQVSVERLARALADTEDTDEPSFEIRVIATIVLAAAGAAVLEWATHADEGEFPEYLARSLEPIEAAGI